MAIKSYKPTSPGRRQGTVVDYKSVITKDTPEKSLTIGKRRAHGRNHHGANKQQIKNAVEKIYDVKVTDVRTMNRKGKPRRAKFKMTTTSDWKRAIVVLAENSRIELF